MFGEVILFKNPDEIEKNGHGIERTRNAYQSAIEEAVYDFEITFGRNPVAIICTPKVFANIQNEIMASGQMRSQWLSGEGANLVNIRGVYVWGAINYNNENESVVL